MKSLITFLFAVLVMFVPLTSFAFSTGEKLNHFLSVCVEKQDAIDILDTYRKEGTKGAEKVWAEKENCANLEVVRGTVGKVVYSVKGEKVFSAVEILIEGRVVAYFLTGSPVNKAQNKT